MRALFLVAAVVVGCAGGERDASPPGTFSIDSEFSAEQAGVLRAGVAAWCDAVGWCPEEVTYSERGRFILARDYVRDSADDQSSAYLEGKGNIFINAGSGAGRDLHRLWLVATHEAGHYGIDGHPVEPPSLMAAGISKTLPREIDEASRQAWCDGQVC